MDLIIGPMFSGKTTELLRRYRLYKIAKKRCILIKPNIDKRYSSNEVMTHDSITEDAVVLNKLNEFNNELNKYDIICIDEGQFFPDIYDTTLEWSDSGKLVIIAMLNGTYERKPFNNINNLVSVCKDITKLNAICNNCHSKDGIYSYRKTVEQDEILIGGLNEYEAICSKCYNSKISQK